MQWRLLVLTCVLLLLISFSDGARKGGRRKAKHRKAGSQRMIFYTNPRRKEYYDNENGARIIKASHFDYEFLLGHKIVFICAAKGDPRPRITWFKDGIELHAHPFLQTKHYLRERWSMEIPKWFSWGGIYAASFDKYGKWHLEKDEVILILQITEWHTDPDHIKSKLEITPARQMDSGTYDCEANNKYSIDRRSFKADFGTISK